MRTEKPITSEDLRRIDSYESAMKSNIRPRQIRNIQTGKPTAGGIEIQNGNPMPKRRRYSGHQVQRDTSALGRELVNDLARLAVTASAQIVKGIENRKSINIRRKAKAVQVREMASHYQSIQSDIAKASRRGNHCKAFRLSRLAFQHQNRMIELINEMDEPMFKAARQGDHCKAFRLSRLAIAG